jgi:hydrogenase nickel incorporation protein HypA/HybF
MHELGLVLQLVDLAAAELRRAGHPGPVERLNLAVGTLSGASPEALHMAFSVVAPERGWDGAELAITEVPARARCAACGHEQDVADFVLACPACGDPRCSVEGGRDLQLVSIDVAEVASGGG